jgi:hypothetical protein
VEGLFISRPLLRARRSVTPRPRCFGDTTGAFAGSVDLPPALLRRCTAVQDAEELVDVVTSAMEEGPDRRSQFGALSEPQCRLLLRGALERGNVALARSIFVRMSSHASPPAAQSSMTFLVWPQATADTAAELVIGLCKALKVREAIEIIRSVRARGVPRAEEVAFGVVVEYEGAPLAVVPPQQGVQRVADAYTKYEYELFSGTVVETSSESSVSVEEGLFAALSRRLRAGSLPRCRAVHTALIETPSGRQRTFRFGTASPDVPFKVGSRVTVVCAPGPSDPGLQGSFKTRFFPPTPPRTLPGEPLSVTEHSTDIAGGATATTRLLRPPPTPSASSPLLPPWLLPVVVFLAASDAATSLVDPVLPYVVAGAFTAGAAGVVAGNTFLIPRLKQLPPQIVDIQATRQKLLGRHASLEKRVQEIVAECEEDATLLARLWQLQAKMKAVVAQQGAGYEHRMERVEEAREVVEGRVAARLRGIDAYARVLSMIEIELEMESQLRATEVDGIEAQILRLSEVEELAAEWKLQAEAADEVERLLRSPAPP